jgi:hypothetical protein
MTNLHDRLDEIEGVIKALGGDVRRLESQFGPPAPTDAMSEAAGIHGLFVRAVFALIEAVVEQHKRLLLDLDECAIISLGNGVAETLEQEKSYLRLRKKIQLVYKAAGDAFGQPIDLLGDGRGWQAFESATNTRDHITHPKSFEQCRITFPELDAVRNAEKWFRDDTNRGFVKAAEQPRASHGNWSRSAHSCS